MAEARRDGVPKLAARIEGYDLIANGGLPRGRATLMSGTSGSARTVFAAQFLAAGITQAGEPGSSSAIRSTTWPGWSTTCSTSPA